MKPLGMMARRGGVLGFSSSVSRRFMVSQQMPFMGYLAAGLSSSPSSSSTFELNSSEARERAAQALEVTLNGYRTEVPEKLVKRVADDRLLLQVLELPSESHPELLKFKESTERRLFKKLQGKKVSIPNTLSALYQLTIYDSSRGLLSHDAKVTFDPLQELDLYRKMNTVFDVLLPAGCRDEQQADFYLHFMLGSTVMPHYYLDTEPKLWRYNLHPQYEDRILNESRRDLFSHVHETTMTVGSIFCTYGPFEEQCSIPNAIKPLRYSMFGGRDISTQVGLPPFCQRVVQSALSDGRWLGSLQIEPYIKYPKYHGYNGERADPELFVDFIVPSHITAKIARELQ